MAYTVKKGDTLSGIAKATGTTVKAIQAANPQITNVNLIRPGQVFDIPSKGQKVPSVPKVPASDSATVAPVVPGLTPEQIAAQILAASTASAAANAAEVARQQQAAEAERLLRAGQSAYDILLAEFSQYGLGSLVEPLKALIVSGPSSSELTLALRASPAYQDRFAANKERVKKGLAAYNEATYIALEDGYQSVMRNYGLPASYYTKDATGKQVGFETLLAGDVKVPELEERIILGKTQLLEGPAETKQAFAQFFPNITEGDILGYVLDPEKGLSEIKRKVSAAQIGGAFLSAKTTTGAPLTTSLGRAEELATYGVTEATARQAATAIGGGLERGRQLTSFYQQSPYTQELAEQELLNLPGQVGAADKRKTVIGLEKAEFGKKTGLTSGALSRDRSGSY